MRFALLFVVALVACDPGPSAPQVISPAAMPQAAQASSPEPANEAMGCGKPATKGASAPKHVTVFGKIRSYMLFVPTAYSPSTSQPLIYVLHGHGGSGAQARASFDLEAPAAGNGIFVYPDALGGGWDLDSDTAKNRDVALFDAILAQVQSAYCIDFHRVFIAGFSNGAYMANQLACRRSQRVRAVATHSGGGPYDTGAGAKYDEHGHLECSGKPVGALVIHGTADGTVVPAEGQKSIDHWVNANHCGAPTPNGACATYANCINPVIACKPPGVGHSVWLEAPKRAWAFFDAQR